MIKERSPEIKNRSLGFDSESRYSYTSSHYSFLMSKPEKPQTSSHEETEILFPAFKDTLLPQLSRSRKSLPAELKELVEKIEYQRKAIYQAVAVSPDEIRAMREMQETLLAVFLSKLETHLDEVPGKVRTIAEVLLSVRGQIRAVLSRVDIQNASDEPEKDVVGFFQNKLSKTVAQMKRKKLLNVRQVEGAKHFPELPLEVKFALLFLPFEDFAAREGILPEEAMDIKKNREAASIALAKLLKVEKKVTAGFYSNVARGQREQGGGRKREGLSLWMKYQQTKKIKDAKKSSLK